MQRVVSRTVPVSESPFNAPQDAAPNFDVRDMPPPEGPAVKSKSDTELIITALTQLYVSVGQGVFIFVNQQDGRTIVREAEDLAESWRQLLDNDPKLRRIMKGMIKGGGWGTVITAHLAVAMPIISNHEGGLQHLIKRKNGDDATTEPGSEPPPY